MLCDEYDQISSNLKNSFFRHFCKCEQLKWKPSLIWGFKENIENQKAA